MGGGGWWWLWIKYDNRARGEGNEQRRGGRGLILGVVDRECVIGGGLDSPDMAGVCPVECLDIFYLLVFM